VKLKPRVDGVIVGVKWCKKTVINTIQFAKATIYVHRHFTEDFKIEEYI
jgi:hypothetical protein